MTADMEWIKPYREKIDDLDNRIIDLLVERTGVIREVGHIKAAKNIPAVIPDRVNEVRERNAERAEKNGLDAELVRELYTKLIDYSCNLEEDIIRDKAKEDIFG